jgi:hexosaminidase
VEKSGCSAHMSARLSIHEFYGLTSLRWLISLGALMSIIPVAVRAAAGHNAVLPRPQQIRYGAGRIPLHGLSIRLAGEPDAEEDRFAAARLSDCLSDRAKEPIRASRDQAAGKVITLKRTGPPEGLPMPGELPGPGSREAYTLRVDPEGVEVQAISSAGLFYGVQTLCQLVEGNAADADLPEVEVRDWPSFAYRGTMVDMSHGPLPTEDEIKRQLDFLARWKGNQYYLYSEASIELDGFPLLNPDGRLSRDQLQRIIAYARERHVDVVPNLELYAHLHDLFRVEEYSELADIPHGVEFDARNAKVETLLRNWVEQFAALFPSPFVHIGFDETFQIDMALKQAGGSTTPAKLFVKQLGDVTRLFQQRGKHVLAFGDIMIRYPEIVSELPPGVIAVAWHYKTDPNDKEYKHWLGPLVAKAVPHFVQPGVSSWAHISPDFDTTFENIDTFLAAGRRSNALGTINSVWADDAQLLMRASLPGVAYGAIAAWQSVPVDRSSFFSDYARVLYPADISADVAAALEAIARSETELQKAVGDYTMFALWEDPFFPAYLKALQQNQEHLRQARLSAEEAETHLYHALGADADPINLRSLLVGSRLLDYAGQKFQTPHELIELWRRVGTKRPVEDTWWNAWESQVTYQDHSRLVDLMDAITELRSLYRSEWLEEYTPYRLTSALGRWDGEYNYWRRLQEKFQQYSDSSQEGDVLPPLETLAEGR